MRSNRTLAALVVAALSCTGCGDDHATTATGGGSETPQALLEQVADVGRRQAMDEMIPLVLPEQRGMIAYMLGMVGPTMTIGMMEMAADMAADPEASKAAKKKMAVVKEGWAALLEKHGIQEPGDDADNPLMGDGDPKQAMAELDKLMRGVDHQAFVRDSLAFLDEHRDKDQGLGAGDAFKDIDPSRAKIEVHGDTATIAVPDNPQPLGLVKKNGRWYIDLMSTMGG